MLIVKYLQQQIYQQVLLKKCNHVQLQKKQCFTHKNPFFDNSFDMRVTMVPNIVIMIERIIKYGEKKFKPLKKF